MMPLKKPFTRPLSFQSFQDEIDFLIQFPTPTCYSNPGYFPQPDNMEVLSLGTAVGVLFWEMWAVFCHVH